ncbi:hypothetical protein GCM10009609_39540 [Pseudonocardia aurantiaca]|uniref:Secreted protein n=1 Tax=Pseudonocardia aurantiaca TaxID=75290 RepID=A0ABW4FJE1_9PSEU
MRRTSRALLVVFAVGAAMLAGAAPALAHGGVVGEDLHVAASLGDRELTVIVRRVGPVPGPLRVDVVNHAGSPGGTLRIRAAAFGAVPAGDEVGLRLADGGGLAGVTLHVDRVGAWELALDDGRETARIPFVVPADVTPAWQWVMSGGYTAAGALLLAALGAAAFGRRTWPPLVLGGGAATAVVVATTAALLSQGMPEGTEIDPVTGRPPATTVPDGAARPHVNLLADAALVAGQRSPIDLRLVDGATGRPVDDLVVHHNALVHLVVLGPGGQFAHLHPARLGPGELRVWFRPSSGGEHRVYAELERRGAGTGPGGVQLVQTTLSAAGPALAETTPAGLGDRDLAGGTSVRVEASRLVAGEPSVLAAEWSEDGRPVRDLQQWLGMAGHLITVGPDATVGHVHAMPPAAVTGSAAAPDETVASGGPRIEFVYTFPTPGRHRLWFQVERDYEVVTVPVEVDVAAAAPRAEAGS